MTGKPGRIEASGWLGAGVQDILRSMKSAEAARNSRSDNVSVSSRGLSDPVPSGKLRPMAPGVRFKISSPPEDFHVAAIGGRNDTQTNSSADLEVDGRFLCLGNDSKFRSIFIRQRRSCAYTRSGADVL
jgi:hypothetical protein